MQLQSTTLRGMYASLPPLTISLEKKRYFQEAGGHCPDTRHESEAHEDHDKVHSVGAEPTAMSGRLRDACTALLGSEPSRSVPIAVPPINLRLRLVVNCTPCGEAHSINTHYGRESHGQTPRSLLLQHRPWPSKRGRLSRRTWSSTHWFSSKVH